MPRGVYQRKPRNKTAAPAAAKTPPTGKRRGRKPKSASLAPATSPTGKKLGRPRKVQLTPNSGVTDFRITPVESFSIVRENIVALSGVRALQKTATESTSTLDGELAAQLALLTLLREQYFGQAPQQEAAPTAQRDNGTRSAPAPLPPPPNIPVPPVPQGS